jgi:hypothetical protein
MPEIRCCSPTITVSTASRPWRARRPKLLDGVTVSLSSSPVPACGRGARGEIPPSLYACPSSRAMAANSSSSV